MNLWSFALAVLVATSLCLWIVEANLTSSCSSEESQLASGLIHLRSQDFMVFTVNPPLPRMIAAIPAALGDAKTVDRRTLGLLPHNRNEYAAGSRLLQDNAQGYRTYLCCGRVALLVFPLAGLFICFTWAASDFGNACGLCAGCLWTFAPYVLGHGSTISSDVPAAAMGCLAVYCFGKWLKGKDWGETVVAGVLLGLAELCKFTLLVFYPMFIVMWVGYRLPDWRETPHTEWGRQLAQLAVIFIISVYVINCGYLFEGTCTPLEDFRFQTTMFTGCESLVDVPPGGANRFAGTWIGKVPVPFPANMIQGIDTQRYDFEQGLPSYLRGQWADHGWWYYYLYSLLLKMPLGTWGLLFLALFATSFLKGYNVSWRDEMVVLLPLVTLLVFVSSQTGFSVHSRYIIPALPFLFIWISKVGKAFTAEHYKQLPRSTLGVRFLAVFFLGWMIVSSMAVYPHSLSYFNELAAVLPTPADTSYPQPVRQGVENRGILSQINYPLSIGARNGPRHLLDSNIDWGQDLFHLKRWLDAHPEVKLDGLAYLCSYPAAQAGIPEMPWPLRGLLNETGGQSHFRGDNTKLGDSIRGAAKIGTVPGAEFGPKPGWYALSVNYIYSRDQEYRYFLNFEPAAMAGYSIYIYHITLEEANRVRREMGLSELQEADCKLQNVN